MNNKALIGTAQLELGFGALRAHPTAATARRSSICNPQWWFRRMRDIVDRAIDWQPALPPRPEQIDFPGREFQLRTA